MNDQDSYSWFFRAEYPGVVRTTYLVVRDVGTAEDAAQEAFIQLLRHWRKVSRYEQPDAWVRRIAMRKATRRAKRDRKRSVLEGGRAEDRGVEEGSGALEDLVRSLPPQQRAAIVLFYYEDRPVSEIASVLTCSESTVKVHLHRARKALGQRLGGEAFDVE